MTQVVMMTMMITMIVPDTECPLVPLPLMGGSADSEGTAGVMLTIITSVTQVTPTINIGESSQSFHFHLHYRVLQSRLMTLHSSYHPHYITLITVIWSLVTISGVCVPGVVLSVTEHWRHQPRPPRDWPRPAQWTLVRGAQGDDRWAS